MAYYWPYGSYVKKELGIVNKTSNLMPGEAIRSGSFGLLDTEKSKVTRVLIKGLHDFYMLSCKEIGEIRLNKGLLSFRGDIAGYISKVVAEEISCLCCFYAEGEIRAVPLTMKNLAVLGIWDGVCTRVLRSRMKHVRHVSLGYLSIRSLDLRSSRILEALTTMSAYNLTRVLRPGSRLSAHATHYSRHGDHGLAWDSAAYAYLVRPSMMLIRDIIVHGEWREDGKVINDRLPWKPLKDMNSGGARYLNCVVPKELGYLPDTKCQWFRRGAIFSIPRSKPVFRSFGKVRRYLDKPWINRPYNMKFYENYSSP